MSADPSSGFALLRMTVALVLIVFLTLSNAKRKDLRRNLIVQILRCAALRSG
jgi:hypothetical protein